MIQYSSICVVWENLTCLEQIVYMGRMYNMSAADSNCNKGIIWILALSLVYFFIGILLFRKKYKY